MATNNPAVQKQAQDFATKVMSMNRHQRRAFAKHNKTPKIYGSTVPFKKK